MKKSFADASPPSVSVVIPAYNAERTIARAVASALAQTMPPLEVIVIDDGSSDQTVQTVEAMSDARIQLLWQPTNRGPAAARNLGLDRAQGSWIAYLDADDSWHPQKLERCLAVASEHPDAILVYHRYTTVGFPEPMPAARPQRKNWQAFLLTNLVATPSALHPASAALRWNEGMRHMEDYDFFLRIAERGPVVFLPLPLVRLGRPLLSPGGLSADVTAMRAGERRVLRAAAHRQPLVRLLLPGLLLVSKLKAWIRPWRRVG